MTPLMHGSVTFKELAIDTMSRCGMTVSKVIIMHAYTTFNNLACAHTQFVPCRCTAAKAKKQAPTPHAAGVTAGIVGFAAPSTHAWRSHAFSALPTALQTPVPVPVVQELPPSLIAAPPHAYWALPPVDWG